MPFNSVSSIGLIQIIASVVYPMFLVGAFIYVEYKNNRYWDQQKKEEFADYLARQKFLITLEDSLKNKNIEKQKVLNNMWASIDEKKDAA